MDSLILGRWRLGARPFDQFLLRPYPIGNASSHRLGIVKFNYLSVVDFRAEHAADCWGCYNLIQAGAAAPMNGSVVARGRVRLCRFGSVDLGKTFAAAVGVQPLGQTVRLAP